MRVHADSKCMWQTELLAHVSGRNARAKTGRYLARERVYCLAGTCHSMVKASTLHLHAVEESACRALRAGSLIGEEGRGGGTWLDSRQAGVSALLIIMSGLQVSQLTVGGGWGRCG